MSDKEQENQQRFAPDKLLANFTRSRFMVCLGFAVAAHILLAGATSVGYIKANVFGIKPPEPEPKKEEVTASEPEATAPDQAAGDKKSTEEPATAAKNGATNAASKPVPGNKENKLLEKHKDTAIVKEITATAKPEEIPTAPDELGISIEETNPD